MRRRLCSDHDADSPEPAVLLGQPDTRNDAADHHRDPDLASNDTTDTIDIAGNPATDHRDPSDTTAVDRWRHGPSNDTTNDSTTNDNTTNDNTTNDRTLHDACRRSRAAV